MSTFRVAIVGAGPAGYFSAQALQSHSSEKTTFKVDLFEKLPTPWGLVRSGVAPDHPKIKSVSKVFEKVSDDPNFRLFANVEIGKDIALYALKNAYDAVIIATGTPMGRRLNIPGENLQNSWSSAEFVPWYNGHPSFENLKVDLSGKRAVVIGAGNVAMDVARILAINPKELEKTDIANHALEKLCKSEITEVWICARRGAEYASFTAPELNELPEMASTSVMISPEDIESAKLNVEQNVNRHVRANLDVMEKMSGSVISKKNRVIVFRFSHVPIEIRGKNEVESVVFDTNHGRVEVAANVVVTAIGYQPDRKLGIQIEDNHLQNVEGFLSDNLYVVGWARRGSSGVIGSNKSDAKHVVSKVVDSLRDSLPKNDSVVKKLLGNLSYVNLYDWRAINQHEIGLGIESGRPRVKFRRVKEMTDFLEERDKSGSLFRSSLQDDKLVP